MRDESYQESLRIKLGLRLDATRDDIANAAIFNLGEQGVGVSIRPIHDGYFHQITLRWDGYELVHQATERIPIIEAYREWDVIETMRREGFTVQLDRMSDQRFRVRVKGDGYNVHTTSTSGYPVLAAFEKWNTHRKAVAA